MRIAYETMLAEFERVLANTVSVQSVPTKQPRSLPRTVWPACSATG